MTITRAVIPAAGFGTRMLPAVKAIPKEMVPVVDKPAIQYSCTTVAPGSCTRDGHLPRNIGTLYSRHRVSGSHLKALET